MLADGYAAGRPPSSLLLATGPLSVFCHATIHALVHRALAIHTLTHHSMAHHAGPHLAHPVRFHFPDLGQCHVVKLCILLLLQLLDLV